MSALVFTEKTLEKQTNSRLIQILKESLIQRYTPESCGLNSIAILGCPGYYLAVLACLHVVRGAAQLTGM